MATAAADIDRIIELVSRQAAGPLPPAEEIELKRLLRVTPDVDVIECDSAEEAESVEPLTPLELAQRVHEATQAQSRDPNTASWLGWTVAAVSIALALIAWLPRRSGQLEPIHAIPTLQPQTVLEPPAPVTPAAGRSELMVYAADLVRGSWLHAGAPEAQSGQGDVVWSTGRQEGYARMRGLDPNDPLQFQYQLWICDRARPGEAPVNGGLFDVEAGTLEMVIPINATLHVSQPLMFMITVEPRFGSVQPTRTRIALVAEAPE